MVVVEFYLQRFDYSLAIFFRHTERMAYVHAIRARHWMYDKKNTRDISQTDTQKTQE